MRYIFKGSLIICAIGKLVVSFAMESTGIGLINRNKTINSIKTSQIYKQLGACMN